MPDSFSEPKRRNLEIQLISLHEEYESANAQLIRTLSEVDRIRIRRQIDDLEREIFQTETRLDQISSDLLAARQPIEVQWEKARQPSLKDFRRWLLGG